MALTPPTARVCRICGKPGGVTYHAFQTDAARAAGPGRMESVASHLRCFLKLKRGQATIRYPKR